MTMQRSSRNLFERALVKDGKLRPVLRCLVFVFFWPAIALMLFQALEAAAWPITNIGPTSVGVACEFAAAIGVAVVLRWFLDRRSAESLGFTFRVRWLRLLGIGLLLGIGMQTLVLATESAMGFAHASAAPWSGRELATLGYAVALLLLAAITEEIAMRGYLFQNLMEEWGPGPAVVITSLAFAALHLANPGAYSDLALSMTGIAAAGVLFALSVLWTRSLWLALGCHLAWNLFEGPIYGLPVSGLSFGSSNVLTESVTGPIWFTGGSFGPEGGLSSIIALAAGTAVLYALHRRGAFTR
jgi:membrane protease YdiL (CAAX protease family)